MESWLSVKPCREPAALVKHGAIYIWSCLPLTMQFYFKVQQLPIFASLMLELV